jgi:hypothetical protein
LGAFTQAIRLRASLRRGQGSEGRRDRRPEAGSSPARDAFAISCPLAEPPLEVREHGGDPVAIGLGRRQIAQFRHGRLVALRQRFEPLCLRGNENRRLRTERSRRSFDSLQAAFAFRTYSAFDTSEPPPQPAT